MNKQLLKDSLGWGFLLWVIGYGLGIGLFMVMPGPLIGWVIMPIGIIITLWVLIKKIKDTRMGYYLQLSIIWMLMAVIFDYLFIVKAFHSDSYYKFDVYVYYGLTFGFPLIVGWRKNRLNKG